MDRPTRWLLPAALSLSALLGVGVAVARTESARPPAEDVALRGPTLGWTVDASAYRNLADAIDPAVAGRVVARLEVDWAGIEDGDGRFDWRAVLEAATDLDRAGAVVVLALGGSHPRYLPDGGPPSPWVAGSVEAWVDFARSAVRAMQGRALVFEIACADPVEVDPEQLAYLVKYTAIGVRAEARESGVVALVAQPAVPAGRIDVQEALWAADVAPYVDVLPVRVERDEDIGAIPGMFEAALRFPPAPSVWVHAAGDDPVGESLAALAAGAATAVVAGPPRAAPDPVRILAGVQATLAEGFAPAPREDLRFRDGSGAVDSAARLVAQYFSEDTFESLLVVDPGGPRTEDAPLVVEIPSAFVRDVRVTDPGTGTTRRTAARAVEGSPGERSVTVVAPGGGPVLVRYRAGVPLPEGVAAQDERVDVDRTRGLTAQEIIAAYQAVQKRQDDRLDRWTADARIDFHFRLVQGGPTIDVTIESRYFWERGGALEWEQYEYRVNGNRLGWQKIPELPLIQPEKVVTLPLDLTLDRTYVYRLAGEDRVDGREAYVLTFEPAEPDPTRALYRGRVWIDRESFVRLKSSVVQTGLEAPVLSNEETDTYRPVEVPGGSPFWMFSRIDGQQVWNVAGRNLLVRREVEFRTYDINPSAEEFERERSRAYASENRMLRDTDDGYRYLERQSDGSRTVKDDLTTSTLFAVAGLFRDNSTEGVVPLAGVNWFDFDLGGKNVQTNVFFAGALGFGTLTVPNLFDRKLDVTLDVGLSAIRGEDRYFEAGEEIEALRVRTRTQRTALRFGIPMGSFVKVNLIGAVNFVDYDDSDTGRDARPDGVGFVLPPDHREASVGAEFLFNRRGWQLEATYRRLRRSEWRPWGLSDESTGAILDPEYDPSHQSFERWSANLRREWYLGGFHIVQAELTALGGADFDRFSEYGFSFFGDDRLFGFSGSGVRFDRGEILRASYRFNVLEAIRFQGSVDTARVRSARDAGAYQRFTGIGASANFVAPWQTIVNIDVGYALASDIPEVEGDFEVLAFVLKLF